MFSWNSPYPTPVVQQELERFAYYRLTKSTIGHTPLVEVDCNQCGKRWGPVWLTKKAIRSVCRNGRCWTCN